MLASTSLRLHIADLDRRRRAAELVDLLEFGHRLGLELGDLAGDLGIAVENVAIFQEVGLIGHDLLHAQRPLLVEGARQAERLVPGRQLHGAGAGVLGENDGEHLDQDAIDVVFRLLLGEAERIDLHAIAEAAELLVLHAIALARDLVPKLRERPHLAEFGDEAHAGVDEEGDAADDLSEVFLRHSRGFHAVENGDGGRERVGQFLRRRRAGFLQMVGADVHRIELGAFLRGEENEVLREAQRLRRREHIGAARQIFLDDVVLRRALQFCARRALFLGGGDIERHQPHGGGVDGHRRVHLGDRNAVEERAHVAKMRDRHADLADLAARENVVAVVAGLRRQIEGDGETGLALGEIGAIELVGLAGGRMAGVGAKHPGLVAARGGHVVHIASPPPLLACGGRRRKTDALPQRGGVDCDRLGPAISRACASTKTLASAIGF